MSNNEVIIVSETSTEEGDVTVVEVISAESGSTPELNPAEGETNLVAEIIEAVLDDDSDADSSDTTVLVQQYVIVESNDAGEFLNLDESAPELVLPEVVEAEYVESYAEGAEETVSPVNDYAGGGADFEADSFAAGGGFSSAEFGATSQETQDQHAAAEAEAYAETAAEAQQRADEAIEAGDYEAAAAYREDAENAAWKAGSDDVLHGSDSIDLEQAAYQQDWAEYYEEQQAQHAREGDYEAAREDAANAGYAMEAADYAAGGSDHSGQADLEYQQMDWAVWEEGQADWYAQNAEAYAAEGDFDNAAMYAENAIEHQATADYHGDMGEHGGEIAVWDPSSEVAQDTYSSDYGSDYGADYGSDYSYDSYDSE